VTVEVRCEPDGEHGVVVRVHGDLDLDAEEQLVREVEVVLAGTTGVVIDLAEVDFIDSSGVRALLRLRRAHADRIRLGEVTAAVKRVLDIAGVTELFERVEPAGDVGGSAP
jgi:anti-sigma B factor antagonist